MMSHAPSSFAGRDSPILCCAATEMGFRLYAEGDYNDKMKVMSELFRPTNLYPWMEATRDRDATYQGFSRLEEWARDNQGWEDSFEGN